MTIFYRYLTREIGICLFIVLASVMGIYVAVDFIEKIDNFMEAGVPAYRCGLYLFYKLPFIAVQIAPLGLLVAILIAIGIMVRNNEVLALSSCGIGKLHLLKPALGAGFVCGMVVFMMAEWIMPVWMSHANQIWLQEVRKKNLQATRTNDIWLRSAGRIIHIDQYLPAEKEVSDITVYGFDDQFHLVERIDAPSGVFSADTWELSDVIQQRFEPDGAVADVSVRDTLKVNLGIHPDDLTAVIKRSDEMSMAELKRHIEKMQKDDQNATRYQVDYHSKGATPFVCVLLSLLGTGIALGADLHEAMAKRILYGMAAAFLYWIFNSFCLSLGYAEMMPPLVSAWVANLVFLCAAALILLKVR